MAIAVGDGEKAGDLCDSEWLKGGEKGAGKEGWSGLRIWQTLKRLREKPKIPLKSASPNLKLHRFKGIALARSRSGGCMHAKEGGGRIDTHRKSGCPKET